MKSRSTHMRTPNTNFWQGENSSSGKALGIQVDNEMTMVA